MSAARSARRSASRRARARAGASAGFCSRRQRAIAPGTPMNDAAFNRKTAAGPRSPRADRRAPGRPSARHSPRCRRAPRPAGSSSRGTRSGVVACQAGAPIAEPMPSAQVTPRSKPASSVPARAERPSNAAAASIHPCVASSSRRRSTMSARAPAGRARTKNGKLVAVCISDTIIGDGRQRSSSSKRRRRRASRCRRSTRRRPSRWRGRRDGEAGPRCARRARWAVRRP